MFRSGFYETSRTAREIVRGLMDKAGQTGSIKGHHAKEEKRAEVYRPPTFEFRPMPYPYKGKKDEKKDEAETPPVISETELAIRAAVEKLSFCSLLPEGFSLNLNQDIPVTWRRGKTMLLGLSVRVPVNPYERNKYKTYTTRLIKHICDRAGVRTPTIRFTS